MSETRSKERPVTCPQCGAPVVLPDYADLVVCPFCGSNLTKTEGASGAAGRPSPIDIGPCEEQQLRSLSCPQCAGPLSVRAGRRILLCSRCGVRILAHGQGGLSRWLFPQNVDKIRALSAASRWLTGHPGIDKKARACSVRQAQLVHVPIWEHKVLVAGWEFGTKLRTRSFLSTDDQGNDRLDLEVTKERFEDPHLKERRCFRAACDLPALGAARPRFSGRELLLPLLAGEVDPGSRVIDAQGDAAAIAEQGRKIALTPTSGAHNPHRWMLILRESLTLLYYPLWLVDYHAGGTAYRIVVDANDGTVNSAVAPAANPRLNPVLLGKVAALVIVAILAAWLSAVWPEGRVPTILLAVIVFVTAVLLVLRSPAGGKVEYHEPFSS